MAKKQAELEDWQKEDAKRLKLIFKNSGFTQLEFGNEFEIGNQSMVGQYLNGIRPLNLTVAGKFAKGLGCKIEKFSPRLAAQIRELSNFVDIKPQRKTAKSRIFKFK
ncbi:MAG: helix-turn-helix transcriptional regulator [Zoogloeaceae bacterium]|jgi:transcriptional regulator with XRE-family HTH domain|nr:helix-turn-helix transcriptional regulator [Zoogloeaceae bacterium]